MVRGHHPTKCSCWRGGSGWLPWLRRSSSTWGKFDPGNLAANIQECLGQVATNKFRIVVLDSMFFFGVIVRKYNPFGHLLGFLQKSRDWLTSPQHIWTESVFCTVPLVSRWWYHFVPSYGGKEHQKDCETCEILTGNGFEWEPAQNGNVPEKAVQVRLSSLVWTIRWNSDLKVQGMRYENMNLSKVWGIRYKLIRTRPWHKVETSREWEAAKGLIGITLVTRGTLYDRTGDTLVWRIWCIPYLTFLLPKVPRI